jgi:hypothetical protein
VNITHPDQIMPIYDVANNNTGFSSIFTGVGSAIGELFGVSSAGQHPEQDKTKLMRDVDYYSALAEGANHGFPELLLSPGQQDRFNQSIDSFTTNYIFNRNAEPDFKPRSLYNIKTNLSQEMFAPTMMPIIYQMNHIAHGNIPAMLLSAGGELAESGVQNIYYHSHKVPFIKGTLDTIGFIASIPLDAALNTTQYLLGDEKSNNLKKELEELPRGMQFLGEAAAEGGVLYGLGAAAKFVPKKYNAVKNVQALEEIGLSDTARNLTTVEGWSSLRKNIEHLESLLPEGVDITTTYPKYDKTYGVRKNWDAGHNEIVIKQAKLDSKYASQHVDYVSIKSNGAVIDKFGSFIIKESDGLYKLLPQKNNPLIPDRATAVKLPELKGVSKAFQHPDSHIPLKEWKEWKKWYSK